MATAEELFSWRSPAAREVAPLRGSLSDDRLIELMAGEPRLIRRPLIRSGDQIIVGFDLDRLAGLRP